MNPPAAPAPDGATVFFCHGSRNADWRTPFEQLATDYRQRRPGERVRLAFLELMSPDLPQVLNDEIAAGTTSVRIVPLFLAPGAHTRRDLAALVADAKTKWPQLAIRIEPTLLESTALRHALVETLAAAPQRAAEDAVPYKPAL